MSPKCFHETACKIEKFQSAYKQGHSTETAMLKVKTDLFDAIDQRKVVCLVLLHLSAAFDTVNHDHLLNHLKYRFGVVGTALTWFTELPQRSYTESGSWWHTWSDSIWFSNSQMWCPSRISPWTNTIYLIYIYLPWGISPGIMELTISIMLMTSNYI